MTWERCDKCGRRSPVRCMAWVMVCKQTHESPAEYDRRCHRKGCTEPDRERED